MNVDKMRRQLDRSNTYAGIDERARWLASLTPEHRAIHTGPRQPMCSVCINAAFSKVGATMAATIASFNAAATRRRADAT